MEVASVKLEQLDWALEPESLGDVGSLPLSTLSQRGQGVCEKETREDATASRRAGAPLLLPPPHPGLQWSF